MENEELKQPTDISYLQFWKSLKQVLKRNFRFFIINLTIKPEYIEIWLAVSNKGRTDDVWTPKMIRYCRNTHKVGIYLSLYDMVPTVIDVATLLYIDEKAIIRQ